MKYHGLTFRLIGREPRLSVEAVATIENCEAACGNKLPEAVREWYSLEGIDEVLMQQERACGPHRLASFLDGFEAAAAAGPSGSRVAFYGPLEVNTGYEAAIALDGSDDPRVETDPPGPTQTFSEFVLSTAWWRLTLDSRHITAFGRGGDYFGAEAGSRELDFLTGQFEELPREIDAEFNFSHRPRPEPFEVRVYRFFRSGQRVEVQAEGDMSTSDRPASFILAADSDELLIELYRAVWPCHGRLLRLGPSEIADHRAFKARFRSRFPEAVVFEDRT